MTAISIGNPTVELSAELESLHQLLYTRGGIRPANAAVEELSKLLLLRLAHYRCPSMTIAGTHKLADLVLPEIAAASDDTSPWKEAFSEIICLDEFQGRLPGGTCQPVWPRDEPFRISRVDVLAEALRVLDHVEFGPDSASSLDPLGVAFDTFLHGRYDHAGGLGTYLTPATVAVTMASIGFELVDSLATGLVGDPCCGTGRFLAAIASRAAEQLAGDALTNWLTERLVGADQSPASVAMARVNMLSYGAHHPHVFTVNDSVTDASLDEWRGQFTLILTNPPFGESKYDSAEGIRRTNWLLGVSGGRSRIDPAVAFVARCIDFLAPDGVAGIVLPDGVLDGPSLRQALLRGSTLGGQVAVEGVISLPTATFAPSGTVAKTSVLFLRRSSSTRRSVFLARASHVGHVMKSGAAVNDPQGNDLPEIVRAVTQMLRRPDGAPVESALVTACDRSSLTSLDASSVDLAALNARTELLTQGGCSFSEVLTVARARRVKLSTAMPFVSVLHLDELGAVKWHEAESNFPSTPGKLANAGDVIVSLLNPAKFRATVIPDRYPEVQVSAEFGIFKTKIDPYAALALLQHPMVRAQLAPLGRGTSSSRRRVDAEDLLGLVCPPFDDAWSESTAGIVRETFNSLDTATRLLFETFSRE